MTVPSQPPPPSSRDVLAGIPAYVAGKPSAPVPGLTSFKLSANENPHSPHPAVLQAAIDALAEMNRYPDMGASAMYAAIADRIGVQPQQLAAGTGSVGVIYHLLEAFCDPGDEIVYAWRSFEAYPIAATVSGAISVTVPLTADFRHDLPAMLAAISEHTKVVLLCSPNNPTGPALSHSEVGEFLAAVPADVVVAIDEAYFEFVRMDDRLDGLAFLASYPNVVVLRTFAKAYGLAGLRVGYAVAHPDVAGAIRATSLPFGVSGVAQATVIAALRVADELLATVDGIVAERDRVRAALLNQGWEIPEAQGNFVWFPLNAEPDAADRFRDGAAEVALAVRPFIGDGVRVSIGEPEANDRLIEFAARFRG